MSAGVTGALKSDSGGRLNGEVRPGSTGYSAVVLIIASWPGVLTMKARKRCAAVWFLLLLSIPAAETL